MSPLRSLGMYVCVCVCVCFLFHNMIVLFDLKVSLRDFLTVVHCLAVFLQQTIAFTEKSILKAK